MNIHEYQAKDIFRTHGIPIPPGGVATTPTEAEALARRFASTVVVKAQVHAGGRGKAGGVKLARTPEETREIASKILGMQIKGLTVQKVLVTPAADIATEAYVGIIVDRASKRPVFMVSPAGGIDIEEVAAKTPDKIMRLPVDPVYGLLPFQALQMGLFLYPDIKQARAAAKIMQQLYGAFWASGASLAEINPLVTTPGGEVVALPRDRRRPGEADTGAQGARVAPEGRDHVALLRADAVDAGEEQPDRDEGDEAVQPVRPIGAAARRKAAAEPFAAAPQPLVERGDVAAAGRTARAPAPRAGLAPGIARAAATAAARSVSAGPVAAALAGSPAAPGTTIFTHGKSAPAPAQQSSHEGPYR